MSTPLDPPMKLEISPHLVKYTHLFICSSSNFTSSKMATRLTPQDVPFTRLQLMFDGKKNNNLKIIVFSFGGGGGNFMSASILFELLKTRNKTSSPEDLEIYEI